MDRVPPKTQQEFFYQKRKTFFGRLQRNTACLSQVVFREISQQPFLILKMFFFSDKFLKNVDLFHRGLEGIQPNFICAMLSKGTLRCKLELGLMSQKKHVRWQIIRAKCTFTPLSASSSSTFPKTLFLFGC